MLIGDVLPETKVLEASLEGLQCPLPGLALPDAGTEKNVFVLRKQWCLFVLGSPWSQSQQLPGCPRLMLAEHQVMFRLIVRLLA